MVKLAPTTSILHTSVASPCSTRQFRFQPWLMPGPSTSLPGRSPVHSANHWPSQAPLCLSEGLLTRLDTHTHRACPDTGETRRLPAGADVLAGCKQDGKKGAQAAVPPHSLLLLTLPLGRECKDLRPLLPDEQLKLHGQSCMSCYKRIKSNCHLVPWTLHQPQLSSKCNSGCLQLGD